MKTINSNINKAKFMALYYGQNVFSYPNKVEPFDENSGGLIEMCSGTYFDQAFLSLRSISSLTETEIRECHNLMQFSGDANFIVPNEMLATITMGMKMGALWQNCSDYLRSIGILIPWMDLSVEDLVEYGWVKIQGND